MTNDSDKSTKDSDISELARRLAAQRRIVEGMCEICGTPFIGTRKKRYCSHNCAQKSYMKNRDRREKGGTKR